MALYAVAAAVLEKFESKQGSVKSLVFASGYKNVRQLYALVCESLKYQPVLTDLFKGSHSLQQEESLQGHGHLATVLLYEHLVGKGLGRAGAIRKCIVKHKKEILENCQQLLEERGVTSLSDLLSTQCQALNKLPIPRYVRVNLLKTTVEDARDAFSQEGWQWRGPLSLGGFQEDVRSLGEEGFGSDPMLSDLLVFPPGTDLHDHPWVVGGCLALQDRASCFPAHVLNAAKGSVVLDCCAAPGNKTSHTASLMANTGKIWAYERDGKRMTLLQQQLRRSGVTNAKTLHQDFLSVDPQDERFSDVEYILVDPSCSGSGIISRMDHVNSAAKSTNNNDNNNNNAQRLLSLQRFQISILKHALRFPRTRRVVYSTCSVHEEENEQVVSEVAQQVAGKFQVAAVFPQFPHRGKGDDGDLAEKCVRMSPENDLTNGFFVACFERVSADGPAADTENGWCRTDGGNDARELTSSSSYTEGGDEAPPSSKKSRKRKRMEESSPTTDGTAGEGFSSSAVTSDGTDLTGQREAESAEPSPKKKKKKKKNRGKNPAEEGEENPPTSQSLLTQEPADLSTLTPDSVTKKKKKKKKKRKKEEQPQPEQRTEKDCEDEPLTGSVNQNTVPSPNSPPSPQDSKKSKKKKQKKLKS